MIFILNQATGVAGKATSNRQSFDNALLSCDAGTSNGYL